MAEKLTPPPALREPVAAVWREVVAAHPNPTTITGPDLETYCELVASLRALHARVDSEGLVVESRRGEPVPHPALAAARATAKELRAWGDRFSPGGQARRRSGYMVNATRKSLGAAKHLGDQHAGPVAALLTLAWLIDEAQRDGIEALQKAAFGTIPTYLKAAAELQLTPASPPAKAEKGGGRGGRLGHLRLAAGGEAASE